MLLCPARLRLRGQGAGGCLALVNSSPGVGEPGGRCGAACKAAISAREPESLGYWEKTYWSTLGQTKNSRLPAFFETDKTDSLWDRRALPGLVDTSSALDGFRAAAAATAAVSDPEPLRMNAEVPHPLAF